MCVRKLLRLRHYQLRQRLIQKASQYPGRQILVCLSVQKNTQVKHVVDVVRYTRSYKVLSSVFECPCCHLKRDRDELK
jgi:transposase